MATKAQIKANRPAAPTRVGRRGGWENAQKSTGPRTDEGKAVVSKNAVKHGLFAEEAVISGEDPAYYDALHDEILAELAPSGIMETLLAERVVSLTWRLKRAVRFQNQLIEVLIEHEELRMKEREHELFVPQWRRDNPPDPGLILGRVIERDYSYKPKLDRLVLYERRIENSLFRTIKELDRRKLARQTAEERTQNTECRIQKAGDGRGMKEDGGGMTNDRTQNTGLSRAKPREHRTQNFAKQSQLIEEVDITSYNKNNYENMTNPESIEGKSNSHSCAASGIK